MENEPDPSLIKATQVSLGKYVKRPQLSEKLLKKPPFRFLHDIVTTVLKSTGFFEGLFDKEELVSENVKDRDGKIQFLNKVIVVVGLTTGKELSAKPSKIVAGQEPEKTNELLQCLAYALDNKLQSVEAVKQFKEGVKSSRKTDKKEKEPSKGTKKNADTKKLTSSSSEKLTSSSQKSKDQRDVPAVKSRNREVSKKDKEGAVQKEESPPKTTVQKSKIINKKTQVEHGNQPPISNSNSSKESSKTTVKNQDKSFVPDGEKDEDGAQKDSNIILPDKNSPSDQDEIGQGNLDASYTIAENDLNSSFSSQDVMESNMKVEGNQLQENLALRGAMTAEDEKILKSKGNAIEHTENIESENADVYQKATPVRKEGIANNTEVNPQERITSAKPTDNANGVARPTSVRPSSSRPGAPRLRDKHGTEQGPDNLLMGKVNIIVENTTTEEEEDSSIIIVEQQPDPTSIDQPEQLISNQHGHLVQQILDSQKEFSQVNGKTEIEWQFGAQKAREASNQEIEQVRFNIQALSRAANPLGKLLDHVQEDVEVMRQELQQWTKTYEETSKELSKQKAANDDLLLPLHTKMKQLDADIKDKQDKIDDLKIVIHKNSSRIEKLLASGSVQ